MFTKKFFFGCPRCGCHYLELFSKGMYRMNTFGDVVRIYRHHKFMCTECWEIFIRVTDGAKVIKTVIDDGGKYAVIC